MSDEFILKADVTDFVAKIREASEVLKTLNGTTNTSTNLNKIATQLSKGGITVEQAINRIGTAVSKSGGQLDEFYKVFNKLSEDKMSSTVNKEIAAINALAAQFRKAAKDLEKLAADEEKAMRSMAKNQIQAAKEDEARSTKKQKQIQDQGRMEDRAVSEDQSRTAKKQKQIQDLGRMQENAAKEDERRDTNKRKRIDDMGKAYDKALKEDTRRTAAQQAQAIKENATYDKAAQTGVGATSKLPIYATSPAAQLLAGAPSKSLNPAAYEKWLAALNETDRATVRAAESEQRLARARVRSAEQKYDRAAGGPGGGSGPFGPYDGSLGGSFKEGLIGAHGKTGLESLGFTVGQAARFGLIYGSFYRALEGMEKAFHESYENAVHFQQSVAELQFQTGEAKDAATSLASSLGRTATQYGESASAGIEAGQKAIGIFNVGIGSGVDTQTRDAVAQTAASVAAKLSFISGKPVDEIVTSLGELTQAFGQGAESIQAVADKAVTFAQIAHVNPVDLLESTVKSSALAETAGLSQNDLLSINASLSNKLGLAPNQTAAAIDNVLSKFTTGPLKTIVTSLGITGDIRSQLLELSKRFEDGSLPESTKGAIIGALGKAGTGKSISESLLGITPLALERAGTTSTAGKLDQAVSIYQDTLGGEMRKLTGLFQQITNDLAKSGVFDVVAALVKLLELLLTGVDGVVRGFDDLTSPLKVLPDALRELAFAALGAAAIMKIAGRTAIGGAVTGRVAGRILVAREAATAEGAVLGRGGAALAAVGGAPVAIAASVLALGVFAHGIYSYNDKIKEANQVLQTAAANLGKLADPTTRENILESIDSTEKAYRGNRGPLGLFGGAADARADRLKDAAALARLYIGKEDKTPTGDASVFGDFGSNNIKSGLDSLAANGYTAVDALKLLNSELDKNGKLTAEAAQQSFKITDFLANIFTGIGVGTLSSALKGKTYNQTLGSEIGNLTVVPTDASDLNSPLTKFLEQPGVLHGLFGQTLQNGKLPSAADLKTVSDNATKVFLASPEGKKFLQNNSTTAGDVTPIVSSAIQSVLQTANVVPGVNTVLAKATPSEAFQNIQNIQQTAQGANFVPGNLTGQLSATGTAIDLIRKQINNTAATDPKQLGASYQAFTQVYAQQGSILVQQARNFLQAKAKGDTDLKTAIADGKAIQGTVLNTAIDTGDLADITATVAAGGDAIAALAKARIEHDHKAALALIEGTYADKNDPQYQAAVTNEANSYKSRLDALTAGIAQQASAAQFGAAHAAASAQPGNAVQAATVALLKAKADQTDAAKNGKDSIAYLNAVAAVNAAVYSQAQAILQAQQSINSSVASQSGSPLAAARAQLKNAELAMKADKGDIVKFTQDLANYFDAARAVAQAAAEAAHNRRELGIDSTDPVQQAAEDYKTAADALKRATAVARDPRGPGGRRITADEQDTLNPLVKTAQQKKAEASVAKYSGQLGDNQDRYDLGQESREQYISTERAIEANIEEQLRGMKKTDEGWRALHDLSVQTKKNIKDAVNGISDQFNLSDINVPTVYQARRYLQAGAVPGGPVSGNSTVIQISGADTGQIIQILSQYIGTGNTYTVTNTP